MLVTIDAFDLAAFLLFCIFGGLVFLSTHLDNRRARRRRAQ